MDVLYSSAHFFYRLVRKFFRLLFLPFLVWKRYGIRLIIKKSIDNFREHGLKDLYFRFKLLYMTQYTLSIYSFNRNNYQKWILKYDKLDKRKIKMIKKKISEMSYYPKISIVMPVYDSPIKFLDEAIQSVIAQIYPYWELCIADDASNNKAVIALLKKYQNKDSRIKVIFRKENGHISRASNSALELTTGDYIALLDHDDVLPKHALFWVADAINKNPQAKLIYSDEDKIDANGKRSDPYFKPDWNPELFLGQNYICHFLVYQAQLVRDLHGFRIGFEGAQDYDLALRAIEQIKPEEIFHIPRVLYHWRIHSQSTAFSIQSKSYAIENSVKALNESLSRKNINAVAESIDGGFRVRYDLPKEPPLVSIIILTKNKKELLENCITSILTKTTYHNYEIILVDNGSDEADAIAYIQSLKKNSRITVIHDDRPFNYSALNNSAVQLAKGTILVLLNNDIEIITPEWLEEMVSISLQPGVGIVGAKLLYNDDTIQHAGVILGVGGVANHSHKHTNRNEYGYFSRLCLISNFSALTGACLLVHKTIYEAMNGLEESNLTIAFNDIDFCLRVKQAGYRNVYTPFAELYHFESMSRGLEDSPKKIKRFNNEVTYMIQKWNEILLTDTAYNPNLTLEFENFSLAWPPRLPSVTLLP